MMKLPCLNLFVQNIKYVFWRSFFCVILVRYFEMSSLCLCLIWHMKTRFPPSIKPCNFNFKFEIYIMTCSKPIEFEFVYYIQIMNLFIDMIFADNPVRWLIRQTPVRTLDLSGLSLPRFSRRWTWSTTLFTRKSLASLVACSERRCKTSMDLCLRYHLYSWWSFINSWQLIYV